MNAFDTARGVEARANSVLLPYLQEQSDGRLVLTNKGLLARWLQESVGDALFMKEERIVAVELKAEFRHTGNLFIETWSNRNLEDSASHAALGTNPGWIYKIRADKLLYYFINDDILYGIDVFHLKRWLFGHSTEAGKWGSKVGCVMERRQNKYDQKNDTWGILAPVERLHHEMPKGSFSKTRVKQRELLEESS